MHELTLCHQTHELIMHEAKLQKAKSVTEVWIEIGALSCIEPEAMRFCFDLVCQGSIAEGCQLHLEQKSATAWCSSCQKVILVKNAFIAVCSQCNSPLSNVDADDKVWVKKIQIKE